MSTAILSVPSFKKNLDEKGRVYIEYTDYGNKTNRGGLKHMKVENKSVRQYENLADPDHCVVNLFVKYFDFIPSTDSLFCFTSIIVIIIIGVIQVKSMH